MKQSPNMRRRHSPIGEVKQSSPRRQNSPSPDVSSVINLISSPPLLISFPHFLRINKLFTVSNPQALNLNQVILLKILLIYSQVPAMITVHFLPNNQQIPMAMVNPLNLISPSQHISIRLLW